MKKLTYFFIALFLACTVACLPTQAQDAKYITAMQPHIQTVYKADSIPVLQKAVNIFERIATAEKTRWEAPYYAAFGYVMMMTRERDAAKKDLYLDQATKAVQQARTLAPQESEVVTLEGFILMMRVAVDPAARGQQYAGPAMQTLNRAVAMNPENPRALSLLAQMQFGTARFFGASTAEACGNTRRAIEKFTTFQPASPLAPQWGRSVTEKLLENCKE